MSGYLPSDNKHETGLRKGGSKYGTVGNDVSTKESAEERAMNLSKELEGLEVSLRYYEARKRECSEIGDLPGLKDARSEVESLTRDIAAKRVDLAAAKGGLKNDDSAAGPGTDSSSLGFDQTEKSTTADRSKEIGNGDFDNKFVCKTCGAEFASKDLVEAQTHAWDKGHSVKSFKTGQILEHSTVKKENADPKPFCDTCDHESNEHDTNGKCTVCDCMHLKNHEGPRIPMRHVAENQDGHSEPEETCPLCNPKAPKKQNAAYPKSRCGECGHLMEDHGASEGDQCEVGSCTCMELDNSSADGLADDPDSGSFSNGPTLDEVSIKLYGKKYKELPDDGAEQDHAMSEYEKQKKNSVENSKFVFTDQQGDKDLVVASSEEEAWRKLSDKWATSVDELKRYGLKVEVKNGDDMENASFNVHCPKCDALTKHTGDEKAGNRRCTECGTDFTFKDGGWKAKNGGDYWNDRPRRDNASESDLARAWELFAEDMLDTMGLGDRATIDVASGKLHPYGRQPSDVRRTFKESYEDTHENSKKMFNGFESKASLKAERDAQWARIQDLTKELHSIEGGDGAGSHNQEPRVRAILQEMKEAEQQRKAAHEAYLLAHERGNSGSGDMLCEDCGKRLSVDTAAAIDNNRPDKALCESCFHKRGMRHSSDEVCPKCGVKVNHSGTPGPLIPSAAKERENMPDGTLTDPEHREKDNALKDARRTGDKEMEEELLREIAKRKKEGATPEELKDLENDISARKLALEHHNGIGLGSVKYGSSR